MRDFVAIIHKDHGSDFGVLFPDFPGCVTAGATVDETKALAQEAPEGLWFAKIQFRDLQEPRPSLWTV